MSLYIEAVNRLLHLKTFVSHFYLGLKSPKVGELWRDKERE